MTCGGAHVGAVKGRGVVSGVQASHCKPDEFTYATIINACTLANKPQLGLKVNGADS